jgi:hypothetical protein
MAAFCKSERAREVLGALKPDDRQAIWGAPVNPLDALADFDPKYIHDGNLGA